MASLCQAMKSHCYGSLAFKKAVCKYFINKDVCFRFCFFSSSIFINKTVKGYFLDDWLSQKYQPLDKNFQTNERFLNGFRAIMPSKVWFKNFYGKISGILIWDISLKILSENVIIVIIKTKCQLFGLCCRQCRQGLWLVVKYALNYE